MRYELESASVQDLPVVRNLARFYVYDMSGETAAGGRFQRVDPALSRWTTPWQGVER